MAGWGWQGADFAHVLHLHHTEDSVVVVVVVVARMGTRFGVKVKECDFEVMHKKLCPNKHFLKGPVTKIWRLEPLPIGTRRRSLAEALEKWKWPAKPIQPAKDARGRAWEVGSSMPPPHNFLSSSEGLVAVTLVKEHDAKPAVLQCGTL